jgi:hypothetical protein
VRFRKEEGILEGDPQHVLSLLLQRRQARLLAIR